MDLFHMQRYQSDDDDANTVNESEIKEQLKTRLKKRKIEVNDDKIEVNDKIPDENEPKKKKKKTKKKKSAQNVDFTILGDVAQDGRKVVKVQRVLPSWLANPEVISADYAKDQKSVDDFDVIDQDIKDMLKSQVIYK